MQHIDRAGTPLEEGQSIRIQQAQGVHGETRILSGRIEKLYDMPPGVTLRLDHDLMDRRSNGHTVVSNFMRAGESIYATLPKDGLETTERFHAGVKFDTWVEVTLPAPAAEGAPDKPKQRMRP